MSRTDGQRNAGILAGILAGTLALGGLTSIVLLSLRMAGVIDGPWRLLLVPAFASCAPVVLALLAGVLWLILTGIADVRASDERWRKRHGLPAEHQHGPAHRWGPRP